MVEGTPQGGAPNFFHDRPEGGNDEVPYFDRHDVVLRPARDAHRRRTPAIHVSERPANEPMIRTFDVR